MKRARIFGSLALRRRTPWIAFALASSALLLLVALQWWWLARLELASTVAGRAVLGNLADAIATEVLYAYAPAAERALDVPAALFASDERLARAAAHFRQRPVDGVRRLFVVRFEGEDGATMLFYDPRRDVLEPPEPSAESRAVTVACAPWRLMHAKAIEGEEPRLVVEERDPEHRIVLLPVLDRSRRILGVAGLILDPAWFRDEELPRTVEGALRKLRETGAGAGIDVSVRDAHGTPWYPKGARADDVAPDVARNFAFVFTDLRLAVRNRDMSPEELAHASFAFNLMLSALAAALAAGGLVLAFRTAAREMRLSQMKSDFVSNVSHELRTPLASIRVFGELMKLGRVTAPDKVREYGGTIESESRRLTQLIDNILDFARIESGRREYHFVPGDVRDVVRAAVDAFRVRLEHEGFTLEADLPAGPLPQRPIDPDALAQAFHNLLDNAVKYSGDSRWIGVAVRAADGGVAVTVSDRGRGIPREEQARIFDRFHRVGTGLVHDVRGSGLGLAIVRHIVAAHGGTVTLDSEPGRGSRFTVHLPPEGGRWRAS